MFSENATRNSEACRFCWMCRHLCPIGLMTGKETNTPRAKGLMVSLVKRNYELTEEMAMDMYECCLCNACTADCATGFEPPIFIREARTFAQIGDLTPKKVTAVINNVLEEGNIFGLPKKSKFSLIDNYIKDLPIKADTVLYVGETAAYKEPEIAIALIKLLKKAGVDFTVIKDEMPSGTELGDLIGYVDDVQRVAKSTADQINAIKAKTLVVLDPSCVRMFKHEYNAWGCPIEAETVTATAYIAGLISENKLSPRKDTLPTVTFHDPCRLARDLDESQPAREIISAMGGSLSEMFRHGKMTKCCGGEIVQSHSPRLTELTATGRWADAERTGAKILVTACPGCLDVMKKKVPNSMRIEDLFVLLSQACGL